MIKLRAFVNTVPMGIGSAITAQSEQGIMMEETFASLIIYQTRAGSLLFRALASRAGNFEKLLAQNCLEPAHNSELLDFWVKKSACQPGWYLPNVTCPFKNKVAESMCLKKYSQVCTTKQRNDERIMVELLP